AKKAGIKIIAVCDTNVNPQYVDYIIPANDDATKTIKMVLNLVGQAVIAGRDKVKAAPTTTEKQ
ncbi:30S ribosomal protein S2, partial [Candidatus Falkowbacteria bacterium]|nr:30S ribosomal protein S2 [Candidatus Falkowbacteria bacterium]